ncbi:MAG: hypothetical protein ACFFCP_05090 [Promethearchaeota archaeon]
MDIMVIFVASLFVVLVFLYLLVARRPTIRDDLYPTTNRYIAPMTDLGEEYRDEEN